MPGIPEWRVDVLAGGLATAAMLFIPKPLELGLLE
jgi:hypothetical protein